MTIAFGSDRINGMRDNLNDPIVFNKYFCDIYSRIFNYWYWIVRHQHSQPIYIATEEIAENDAEYYQLISAVVDPKTTPEEKVELSEKVYARLFR